MTSEESVEVVEYAVRYAGGAMLVRAAEDDEVYPTEWWVRNQRKFGVEVYRRTVRVVEGWKEVTGED